MTPDDRPTPRHAEAIARGEAAWERIRAERDYSWGDDLSPEMRASLLRGLEESARGETFDLGDFTRYSDGAA